ncbi:major facilitator transporter [Caballeronia udeis]|uniref:Major facilitator transporter n=1 Tax=Caballeronia udeis TaxID=1232866 RepID=A0A158JCG6_9BURK|nr:MFS transporter [Caballeronia udeis]SAL66496.1 major facilitator transporter [Caballeronia udeis]
MSLSPTQAIPAQASQRRDEPQKFQISTVWTAFFGFFIDVYDLYLPVMILAPAYLYFKPPQLVSPLLDSFIFAAALLGRPAGALFFGYFADRLGRKRVASVTMAGAGAAVLLTAFMPGYQSIGIASIVGLIVLRFLTGFFAGGQYTGAVTLAMETCPNSRRGFYGGLIGSSSNLSFIVMSLLGLLLFHLLPPAGLDSPYVQWGWRIPFVLGAALAFGFRNYMTRHVEESRRWLASGGGRTSFAALFTGVQVGSLVQGFVLMNGLWLSYMVPAVIVPSLLRTIVKLSAMQVTTIMLLASAIAFFGFVLGGVVSDRIGRRAAFLSQGIAATVIAPVLVYALVRLPGDQLVLAGALESISFFLVGLVWGSGPHSYLNERFHTGNRSAGYGIAFSFAIILPSFFGVYQHWLSAIMPMRDTAPLLLVIGGLVVVIAAFMGPETRKTNYVDQ